MKKLFYTLVVLIFSTLVTFGQGRSVKGKVTDVNAKPLEGVTIRVQGKAAKAVLTDSKGEFSVKVETSDVLLLSFIGMESQRVKVGNAQVLNVVLQESVNLMDEVVVTAGGVKTRRKEIGTAGTIIKNDALIAGKATSISADLQGKVAGLQISNTGGGINPNYRLILRGQRSLTGNNEALVVLDNVIVPTAVLGNLNPEDVEDVIVLNGAGAAALYGSQASNGALIITTKKGKNGLVQVGVSQTTSFESVAFFPKVQTKFGAGGTGYGTDANGQPIFSYLENQSYGPAFH